MNSYQILGLIIIVLCLYNIYVTEKYSNLRMKLHNKFKDLIIKKNKEIIKLEKQLDLVSDQYLRLREDLYQMEKAYNTLKEESWSKKYEV